MKKLLMAAVLAGSMVAVAADAAKTEAPAATPAAAEKQQVKRPQLTEAQKAQMKARREKLYMAERKARQEAMKAKILETIKKYLPDEEKAKALADDLEKTMMSMRRPMPMGRPMGRPNMKRAPKAAPVEKK